MSSMSKQTTRRKIPRPAPFRFLDLPLEIRQVVYQELLCNFKAAPSFGVNDVVQHKPCDYYVRSTHTPILRANKQIHREAYAIMVKTNRFIHVKFYGCLPFNHMLEASTRRIISQHRCAVEAFKGYVMAVSVVPEGLAWFSPEDHHIAAQLNSSVVHCMILGEDCMGLVKTLANVHMPNLGKTLDVNIAVAPYLKKQRPALQESLEPFFSEVGIQENLLLPFRENLRGVQNVKITGVSPTLATAVKEDIAKDEWTDPQAVLEDLEAAKQRGNDAFKAKELREASQAWEEAVNDIERIHQSSSWRGLCTTGGTAFIDAVVELYFSVCLNITHVQLTGVDYPIPGYPSTHCAYVYLQLAEQHIDRVMLARKPGYWKDDYEWDPSEPQEAKLLFRQAMCMKADAMLNDDPMIMMDALRQLAMAKQIVPNDAAIMREAKVMEQLYARMLMAMSPEDIEESGIFDDEDGMDDFTHHFYSHFHDEDGWEDEEEDDEEEDDEDEDDDEEDDDEYDDMPELV